MNDNIRNQIIDKDYSDRFKDTIYQFLNLYFKKLIK